MSSDEIACVVIGFGCGAAFAGLVVVAVAGVLWLNVKAEQRRAARYLATVLKTEVRND